MRSPQCPPPRNGASVGALRPLAAVVVVALFAHAGAAGAATEPAPLGPPAEAPRGDDPTTAHSSAAGHEVLRRDCRTEAGRREVTLFLNGTVRLRQGAVGKENMQLGELAPAARDGFLRRLADEDLSEVDAAGDPGVEGRLVERCALFLDVPGRPPRELRYALFESLPLALSRVVGIADELAEIPYERRQRLPTGYRPRMGDVLRRGDGTLYEVIGRTVDGKGIELQGIDQPLTLFLPELDLAREFDAIVRRR